MSLQAWINSQLKNKGMTVKQAKKNAGKYKSIAAAKKAGSLYYTNKDGKIMIDLIEGYNEVRSKSYIQSYLPGFGTFTKAPENFPSRFLF